MNLSEATSSGEDDIVIDYLWLDYREEGIQVSRNLKLDSPADFFFCLL